LYSCARCSYGYGGTPPGAQYPNGFCRLSPDTAEPLDLSIAFEHTGGYFFLDGFVLLLCVEMNGADVFIHRTIRTFTHAHMQGAGVVDLGAVGLMPFTSQVNAQNVDLYGEGFRQHMDKETEIATPGYYSINLKNDVLVELTATTLCGVSRYTFGASTQNRAVLFLASITLGGNFNQYESGHSNVTFDIDVASASASGMVVIDQALSGRLPGGLPM
jgi:putative alpha-1,2-mannosidase